MSPLNELLINGLDIEQIWEQINLQVFLYYSILESTIIEIYL